MTSASAPLAQPVLLGRQAHLAAPAVLVLSVLTLGAALVSQYGFGLQPCELCIWQRWPYVATILLGLIATFVLRRGRAQGALVLLAGLVFLVGAGIACFHVGVEQHWWAGLPECTGAAGANSIDALRRQLAGTPIVRCDQPAFVFLGISMAGWNMLASIAYAGFSLAAGRALLRRPA